MDGSFWRQPHPEEAVSQQFQMNASQCKGPGFCATVDGCEILHHQTDG